MDLLKKFKKSSDDTKSIAINIFGGILVKGGSLFVGLFTTPSYMRYFSENAVLGVWYTMLSVLTWIMYFDMGIGNGLRNKLVVCLAEKDEKKAREYISSSYIFLGFIGLILMLLVIIGQKFVNWNAFFNISPTKIIPSELSLAVLIVFSSVVCQIIFRMITSIMYAMQKSFVSNLMTLLTSIIMLVYVLVCNAIGKNNNLIAMSVAYFLAVNVPLLIATIVIFTGPLKSMCPTVKAFSRSAAMETFNIGSKFLILQVLSMFLGGSFVVYLINSLLGADSVVEFNIYQKIYSQFPMIFSILLAPLWSAVTKAMAENKYPWIKKTLYSYFGIILLIGFGQLLLLPIMQTFFNFWLGDQTIPVDYGVMIIFSINTVMIMLYYLFSQISNGLNELSRQFKLMATASILIILISLIGIKVNYHYTTIITAQTIALIPYVLLQGLWIFRHLKKECEIKNE